jgi:hypothetical protein
MMVAEPTRRRDVFSRHYVFRSAITGRYVTRAYALLFPHLTVKERVR